MEDGFVEVEVQCSNVGLGVVVIVIMAEVHGVWPDKLSYFATCIEANIAISKCM